MAQLYDARAKALSAARKELRAQQDGLRSQSEETDDTPFLEKKQMDARLMEVSRLHNVMLTHARGEMAGLYKQCFWYINELMQDHKIQSSPELALVPVKTISNRAHCPDETDFICEPRSTAKDCRANLLAFGVDPEHIEVRKGKDYSETVFARITLEDCQLFLWKDFSPKIKIMRVPTNA